MHGEYVIDVSKPNFSSSFVESLEAMSDDYQTPEEKCYDVLRITIHLS